MFFYKKYQPIPPLRPHISSFYILEYKSGSLPLEMPTFANQSCALVFNYGERYRLNNPHYKDELLPRNFLCPVSTAPYKLSLVGGVGSLGVIFQSMAFKELFRLPDLGNELDTRIDADPFLRSGFNGFSDALAEARSPEEKIALANRYFLDFFKPKLGELSVADRAITCILDAKGFITMDELAQKCFVTPRHLRRVFKEQTGVSPKLYARLKRFGYSYHYLINNNFNWRHLMFDKGFYDQSHLIREFRTFSGETPLNLGIIERLSQQPAI